MVTRTVNDLGPNSPRSFAFVRLAEDSGHFNHTYVEVKDVRANASRAWWFGQAAGDTLLATQHEKRDLASGNPVKARQTYGWSQNGSGNWYTSAVTEAVDPDAPSGAASKRTEQEVDGYGNVVATRTYGYDGSLARSYTSSYLSDPTYTSRYMRNRLVSSAVSDGATTVTLVRNAYDQGPCLSYPVMLTEMAGAYEHDAAYNASFTIRGNVIYTKTLAGGTCRFYNTGGVVVQARDSVVMTRQNVTSSTNYAVPSSLTTNALTESLQWSSFLGLTRDEGPNGDAATTYYDSYARPSSSVSRSGATTTYEYTNSPGTVKETTNGRWTKRTLDGFGRVIRVEQGYSTTTVAVVETEYDACGCSPVGKTMRASMPHAPGATAYWTTYGYDGLGRTTSVVAADGASTKRYEYVGATVKATDEAGKWKKYAMDALGNVVQVEEPKPARDALQAGNTSRITGTTC